jgi:hypothetical protein
MGERNSQSEATETKQYLRATKGAYGCEIPIRSNFAIEESGTGTVIFYNESADESDLKDHRNPSAPFDGYDQYDWYCWVDDFEMVERGPEPQYDDDMAVVAFTSGSCCGIVDQDGEYEINGDTIYVAEDAIIENSHMWQTFSEELLDYGLLFSELRFTTLEEARSWLL